MWNRIFALAGALLLALRRSAFQGTVPLWLLGVLGALFGLLVRDELGPRGYAAGALSLAAILCAVPLLGELGMLLAVDPAREWVEALPLRPREARLARLLVLMITLAALTTAVLVPAGLFAPSGSLAYRLRLLLAGVALNVTVAAPLLVLQGLLRERARSILLLLQTALFAGTFLAIALGLRRIGALAALDQPLTHLPALPPAWFASWTMPLENGEARAAAGIAAALALLASATLAIWPPGVEEPSASAHRSARVRLWRTLGDAFATAFVPVPQRGAFELVLHGLPREREFVLRTYPLLGVPLAFLALGTRGADEFELRALTNLLLLLPAALYPVLVTHVPATSTPAAHWLLATAGLPRSAHQSGARKAVILRFVLPLLLSLFVLAATLRGLAPTVAVWFPSCALNLVLLRAAWSTSVADLPLSRAPSEIRAAGDFAGTLLGFGFVAVILAWLLTALHPSPALGVAIGGGIFAVDSLLARLRPDS